MAQRPPPNNMDPGADVAYIHFEALKQYSASYVQSQTNNRQSSQRASAREKLTRLTRQQFEELCTNVFDEMRRRQYNSHEVPFLPVNPEYHPKRNQARQKLATLHVTRFKDLAVDVYLEIERRFPAVTNIFLKRWGPDAPRGIAPNGEFGGGQPVPGTPRVEPPREPYRDDRNSYDGRDGREQPQMSTPNAARYDNYSKSPGRQDPHSPKTANLDNLLADLGDFAEETVETLPKPPKSDRHSSDRRLADENESLLTKLDVLELENRKLTEENTALKRQQQDSESRLDQQQDRINQLERDLNSMQQETAEQLEGLEKQVVDEQQRTAQLQKRFDQIQAEHTKLRKEYDALENDYKAVQEDYNSQAQMISAIRGEATNILEEHKLLERTNEDLKMERERNLAQIRDLNEKLKDTRRETQSSAGSRAERARSINGRPSDRIEPHYEPIIGRQRLTAYNSAIDDLLRAAKSDAPTSVLVAMKSIVLACKEITESTEKFESQLSLRSDIKERLSVVKNRLSSGLTTLMSNAKQHATSTTQNISGLENTTRNLTGTINELLRLLRRAEGREDNTSRSRERNERSRERVGREWERERDENYPGPYAEGLDVDELRVFLEKQTDLMVQGIQSLLFAMKQSQILHPDFKKTVGSITSIVDNLCQQSRKTLYKSEKWGRAQDILGDLEGSNARMAELGESMSRSGGQKSDKQRMATCSSEIAKRVKELVSLLE